MENPLSLCFSKSFLKCTVSFGTKFNNTEYVENLQNVRRCRDSRTAHVREQGRNNAIKYFCIVKKDV